MQLGRADLQKRLGALGGTMGRGIFWVGRLCVYGLSVCFEFLQDDVVAVWCSLCTKITMTKISEDGGAQIRDGLHPVDYIFHPILHRASSHTRDHWQKPEGPLGRSQSLLHLTNPTFPAWTSQARCKTNHHHKIKWPNGSGSFSVGEQFA